MKEWQCVKIVAAAQTETSKDGRQERKQRQEEVNTGGRVEERLRPDRNVVVYGRGDDQRWALMSEERTL